MSDNKVGTYKFVAEPFHCDFTGKLTMSVLAVSYTHLTLPTT